MSTDSAIDTATVAEPQAREIDLIGLDGSKAGTVELPGEIFDVQVNVPLIHQVVVAQLAAARQGTHSTKRRGEVRGGGRKPYRQKGTGRARQGSTRAPQFVGGGVVHGPKPRDYSQRTPKKMKAAALRGALSDRARNGRIHVVTGLLDGEAPSTKSAIAILSGLSDRKHVLVVAQRSDELTWQSLRNAPTVHLLVPDQLNTYDVLVSDDIVFTHAALDEFLAGPSRGRAVTASARESEVDTATESEAATEGSEK
jgi:large subunit ribosomal protein L4